MHATPSPYFLACVRREILPCVGKPWAITARGPDSFDCWGFVLWVLGRSGLQLPDWLYSPTDDRALLFERGILEGWVQVPAKSKISIVTFGKDGSFSHVGIILDAECYHCTSGHGVVRSPIGAMTYIFNTVNYWWPE